MILLKRLHAGLECLLRENQCGFRQNRSCIDQIYSLRTIIHNCLEFNIPLFINFVDFKALSAAESTPRRIVPISRQRSILSEGTLSGAV